MSTMVGVVGFAALFAVFGLLGPVLLRKRCSGESCGSCSEAECKYTE
ncbi:MAG: hypothetical protein ACOC3J_00290 [Gemmatimonadota bacterium]